jgi:hypothetical protein
MRRLKGFKTSVVGVAVVTAPAAMLVFGAGTAGAAPPTPSPGHSTKEPITNQNRNCDGSPATPNGTGNGTGSAVFNIPGPSGPNAPMQANPPNKIIADVSITNATPNATYGVRLIQTPEPALNDCGNFAGPYEGTLATDASGNGSVNLQEPLLPGAQDAFVVLNNTAAPGTDFYTSQEVCFSGSQFTTPCPGGAAS